MAHKHTLDALAKLSGILMDDKVRESLLHANSPEEVLQIIDNADDEATKEEEKEAQEQEAAAAGATSGSANTTDANEPYVLANSMSYRYRTYLYGSRCIEKTSR